MLAEVRELLVDMAADEAAIHDPDFQTATFFHDCDIGRGGEGCFFCHALNV